MKPFFIIFKNMIEYIISNNVFCMNSKDERLESTIEKSFGLTNSEAKKLVDPIKNMMDRGNLVVSPSGKISLNEIDKNSVDDIKNSLNGLSNNIAGLKTIDKLLSDYSENNNINFDKLKKGILTEDNYKKINNQLDPKDAYVYSENTVREIENIAKQKEMRENNRNRIVDNDYKLKPNF